MLTAFMDFTLQTKDWRGFWGSLFKAVFNACCPHMTLIIGTTDRTGDRHHLGVEITLGAAELCRANLVCGPAKRPSEERHAGASRVDH
jgi:hypothetical protein